MSLISRRRLVQGAAAALGAAQLGASSSRPPNFVVVIADDLGWGDLKCYGNPWVKTPSLDRLAQEGTLYTHGYACSPVCSSSRAGMITGRFPSRDKMFSWIGNPEARKPTINSERGMPDWLDPAAPSVARTLRERGYRTAVFGKWHLGEGSAPDPGAYGFDVYRVSSGNGPAFKDSPFRPVSSERIVDASLEFITANAASPFMVKVWFMDPHVPLEPSQALLDQYPNVEGLLRTYCASVTGMDQHIGRLVAGIDALGLGRDTLILFASDNGPAGSLLPDDPTAGGGTAGPFRGMKGSLYEGGIRVPWIARWPGAVPAGKVDNDSIWSGVDFHPTLASLAGGPVPEGLDGDDRSAALRGPAATRRPLFWDWRSAPVFRPAIHASPMLAMREGKWKFYVNPDGSRKELYDVVADPGEVDNRLEVEPKQAEKMLRPTLAYWKSLPEGAIQPKAGELNYPWPMEKGKKKG